MHTTRARIAAALLGAGMLLFSGVAFAAPPTDEAVQTAFNDWRAALNEARQQDGFNDEAAQKIATDAMAKFNIDELTASQIVILTPTISAAKLEDPARARLNAIKLNPTTDGAVAAMHLATYPPADVTDEAHAALIRESLTHKAFADALREGYGRRFFSTLTYAVDVETLTLVKDDLLKAESAFTADLSSVTLTAAHDYVYTLLRLGDAVSTEQRERIRTRLVGTIETARAQLGDDAEQEKRALTRALTHLNGAYLRGELIGFAHPELTIAWSSDPDIESFEDLKGKVVVVDFWATWCGPCVRSFPNIRELVDHYDGYAVTVIGVTSLQGAHFGAEGRIDTKDAPDLEYELMVGYIPEKELTWPVVFTTQDVYNPDFGIMGIPHVAIFAPDGTVRYNGLHPANPLSDKTSKIDPILREFGLPTPPPPPNGDDEGDGDAAH